MGITRSSAVCSAADRGCMQCHDCCFGWELDATSPGDVFFFDPEPAGLERFEIPDVLDEEKFANLNLDATEIQASAWFSVSDLEFILENIPNFMQTGPFNWNRYSNLAMSIHLVV